MSNKRKTASTILGICLFIIISLLLMFITLIPINTGVALAATTETSADELCKLYTDSDTVYGMQNTIRNYPTDLIASNATFVKTNGSDKLKISGDDPIVNIIPKSYFMELGDHFYIGKEYGFFVNTREWGHQSNDMLSTVLVFDITTNTNLEQTMDRLIMRIEPIFQYYFAYISYNSSHIDVPYSDLYFDCEGVSASGNIIAVPRLKNQYKQCEEFYLKDISFGASLFNEQELNPHNHQYQPENDDGSFIIMHDYVYNGLLRTSKGIKPTDSEVASLVVSSIGTVLGVVGLFNPALGALGTLLGGLDTLSSIINTVDQAHPSEPYFVTSTNGKFTATCKYTTRREQLAHYVDEKTKKPALTKAAAIIIEGDDDSEEGNLWYNVGSYAEGYFTLSDSATTTPWYTRYIQDIALSVVDKDGNEHIKNGYGSNTYMLHEPIYKEAKFDDSQQISFLPEGNNYFAFNPQYTSDYTINFDKKYNYVINAQDVTAKTNFTINPVNGVYKYKFIGGHQYKLRVYSPLGDVLNLNIAPADSQTAQSIAGNSTYLYKYACPKNQFVTVSTSQTNAPIANIYTKKEGGGLNRLPEFATFKQSASVEMYLQGKHTYYFLLRNTGTSALSTKVNVNNLDRQLSESGNDPLTLTANDNFRYYKLVPTTTGDYFITFDNSVSEDYKIFYNCFDERKTLSFSTSGCVDGYLVLRSLEANKPYYIGITSNFGMKVTPKLTKTEPKFVWKYAENNTWETVTDLNLHLLRGKSYDFELWINGLKAKNYVLGGNAYNTYFTKITGPSCRVQISSGAKDYSCATVQAIYDAKEGLNYSSTLKIYADFNPAEFVFESVDYNNATNVTISPISGLLSWNVKVTGKDYNGASFSVTHKGVTGNRLDVYNDLLNNNAFGQVTFKITTATIKSDATGEKRNVTINVSKKLNATYSKKKTTDDKTVYYVANALQLNNIRYDQTCDRILANDISLSDYPLWTTIPTLTCNINGNNKKITNLTMDFTIEVYTPTTYLGFVGVNHAKISKLTFENVNASLAWEENPVAWKYAGVIAGANVGTIQHCYVTGNICGYRDLTSIGGIAGANNGNILNTEYGVLNKGIRSKVYSWGDVGGIAGQSIGKIQDCRTLGTDVEQKLYGTNRCAGGIIGYGVQGNSIIRCTVEDSRIANVNEVTVKSLYPKMGIIVGHDDRGIITSVGMSNVTTSTGGLYKNNTGKCFNGGWPFFGWLENCTVDGNTGQTAP